MEPAMNAPAVVIIAVAKDRGNDGDEVVYT